MNQITEFSMEKYLNRIIKKNHIVFLILLAFAAICYTNVINGPFIFDDAHFIELNRLVHSLGNIPGMYTTSVTEGAYISGNFYRPNQQVIYALIYYFYNLQPAPYHLISILLHLANAFLIFILLTRLSFSRIAAFLAALLFTVHPIQTEAVSYISGLADPLGTCFLLGAMITFHRSLTTVSKTKMWLWLPLTLILFMLALFSKENQVIFLPLSALMVLYLFVGTGKKINLYHIVTLLLIAVMTAGYLFLKFSVFKFTETAGLTAEKNVYTENLYIRLITFINVLWEYIRMIFYPVTLNYEKPYVAYVDVKLIRAWFGILLILLTLFLFIRMKKHRKLFLGIAWFFVALAPFTGVIPLNAMYLEHWLYIPIIGILILMARFYEWISLKGGGTVFLIVMIPVIVLFSARTILRNREWSDIEKFYLNELKYTDSSIRIFNNLGMYYADKDNIEKSIYYYQQAILRGDYYPQPHHNLANFYLKKGDMSEAVHELYLALKIDPDFVYSLSLLFEIYKNYGPPEKAQQIYPLVINAHEGRKNDFRDIERIIKN